MYSQLLFIPTDEIDRGRQDKVAKKITNINSEVLKYGFGRSMQVKWYHLRVSICLEGCCERCLGPQPSNPILCCPGPKGTAVLYPRIQGRCQSLLANREQMCKTSAAPAGLLLSAPAI